MGFPLKSSDLLPAASTWRRRKKLENTFLTGTSIFLAVNKGQIRLFQSKWEKISIALSNALKMLSPMLSAMASAMLCNTMKCLAKQSQVEQSWERLSKAEHLTMHTNLLCSAMLSSAQEYKGICSANLKRSKTLRRLKHYHDDDDLGEVFPRAASGYTSFTWASINIHTYFLQL